MTSKRKTETANKAAAKRLFRRAAACLLAAALLLPGSNAVFAGPPPVSTDEAVYVNLDAYGALSGYSVVKGVALNGNTEFTDFGDYTEVINMSNHVVPELAEGCVRWKLEPGTDRFYYECTFDNGQIQLPWTFDVSYKLNGVPVAADTLAGASGLVEITVHAMPNQYAQDYYRNNMMLQLAYVADMQKTRSIDAPGSQLQSVGTYKVALFMAMPGEEGSYTIRIGTDSFESMGLVMLMVPGTLSQLDLIAQLREAEEKVGDAYQAGYDSYNQLLSAIGAMKSPLLQLRDGFAAMDGSFSSDNFDEFENSVKTLSGTLSSASQTALGFIPYLSRTDETTQQLFASARTLNTLAEDMKDDLGGYSASLSRLKEITERGKGIIAQYRASEKSLEQSRVELREVGDDLRKAAEALSDDLGGLGDSLQAVKEPVAKLSKALGNLQDELEELDAIPKLDKNKFLYRGSSTVEVNVDGIVNMAIDRAVDQVNAELRKLGQGGGVPALRAEDFYISQADYPQFKQEQIDQINARIGTGIGKVNAVAEKINRQTEQAIDALMITEQEKQDLHVQGAVIEVDAGKVTGSINRMLGTLVDHINGKIDDLNDSLYFLKKAANKVLAATSELLDSSQDVIDRLTPLSSDMQKLTDEAGCLADALETAIDNANVGDAVLSTFDAADALLDELITDCGNGIATVALAQSGIGELVRAADTILGTEDDLQGTIANGKTAVNQLSSVLSQSAQPLLILNDSIGTLQNGNATADILDGMVAVLDNAAGQIDITGSLHQAGSAINDTIEGQKDKIEDQSNVLEVDPNAELVSFTSPQNPTPASIQIVLRSEEITLDSPEDKADLEQAASGGNVWQRIGKIFIKIWNAVVGIFQEE